MSSTFDALAALGACLAGPIVGHISDVLGRRRVLLAMCVVQLLPTLTFFITEDLWWYFICNVVGTHTACMRHVYIAR